MSEKTRPAEHREKGDAMRQMMYVCLVGVLLCLGTETVDALEVILGMPYGRHTIGHTAVRVRTFDKHKEVVYDFGRYGKTWGYLGFHGEGIMRVWRGPRQIRRYFRKQTSYRDSIGFVLRTSPQEERKILAYYEGKLKRARWRKQGRLHTRYRLKKDYHGVTNQCTSMALEGFKAVLPRKRWEALLHPRYNKGRGFRRKIHRYFFKSQKKLGINEVVVPLDVLAAFKAGVLRKHPDVLQVRRYPRRYKSRLSQWWKYLQRRKPRRTKITGTKQD